MSILAQSAIFVKKQIPSELLDCFEPAECGECYVCKLVEVFGELRRVLRDEGSLFLNLGDTYKDKQLQGIPWRVALALQADGWFLRSDIIWHKVNPMPESCTNRPTKAHEYIFLLTKSTKYWYDQEAIREPISQSTKERWGDDPYTKRQNNSYNPQGLTPNQHQGEQHLGANPAGRNKRTVWPASSSDEILSYLADKHPAVYAEIAEQMRQKSDVWELATTPYKKAHFACFPPKLIEPCILAGCPSRVCVECGEPWVRETEKTTEFHGGSGKAGRSSEQMNSKGKWAGKQYGENIKLGPVIMVKTLGFTPTCQCCPLPAVHIDKFGKHWPLYNVHRPGIVLDPFIGSGTTAQVAIQNKRNWLGIELNPDYIKLAMERIHGIQPALFVGDV